MNLRHPADDALPRPGGILWLPLAALAVLASLSIGAFLLISWRQTNALIERTGQLYQDSLTHIVTMARHAVNPLLEEYRSGAIGRDEALRKVRALVRSMTYEDRDGKNYVFMSAYDGTMLVQPFEPEKEGSPQWDLQDANGFYIVRELVRAAKESPGGSFVRYHYHLPGVHEMQEKMAYVIGLPELDCYLGTGMYMQRAIQEHLDVLARLRSATLWLLLTILLPVSFSILVILNRNQRLLAEIRTRQKTERDLKASEAKYRSIFENAAEGIYQTDAAGTLLDVNPALARMAGYDSPAAMLADSADIHRFYADSKDRDKLLDLLRLRGFVLNHPLQMKRRDGSPAWISTSARIVKDPDGRILCHQGTIEDITEQKRTEEEIRSLNEDLERRIALRTTELERANADLTRENTERAQAEETLRRRLRFENLISRITGDFAHRDAKRIDQGVVRALKEVGAFAGVDRGYVVLLVDNGSKLSLTHEWSAEDGTTCVEWSGHALMPMLPWLRERLSLLEPVRIASPDSLPPEALQERKHLEARRAKSSVVVPLVCGGSLKGFLGFDALSPGWTCPDDLAGLLKTAARSFASAFENKWAEERRQALELQLHQSQKMEAIGLLAAGIAHEINSPVQFIGDNLHFLHAAFQDLLDLLRRYESLKPALKPDAAPLLAELEEAERKADVDELRSDAPKAIAQSEDGVHRVSQIVQAMKEYARPIREEMADADLNRAIETATTLARTEWEFVAKLSTQLDPTLPLVPCHLDDINQVLLQLIVNAAQAIGEQPTPDGKISGQIVLSSRTLPDGVEIRVADNGPGIPEENRSKIFTPFFTTKKDGKSIGQSLALAYHIVVNRHRGDIRFETETGRGATFILRLPTPPPQ